MVCKVTWSYTVKSWSSTAGYWSGKELNVWWCTIYSLFVSMANYFGRVPVTLFSGFRWHSQNLVQDKVTCIPVFAADIWTAFQVWRFVFIKSKKRRICRSFWYQYVLCYYTGSFNICQKRAAVNGVMMCRFNGNTENSGAKRKSLLSSNVIKTSWIERYTFEVFPSISANQAAIVQTVQDDYKDRQHGCFLLFYYKHYYG